MVSQPICLTHLTEGEFSEQDQTGPMDILTCPTERKALGTVSHVRQQASSLSSPLRLHWAALPQENVWPLQPTQTPIAIVKQLFCQDRHQLNLLIAHWIFKWLHCYIGQLAVTDSDYVMGFELSLFKQLKTWVETSDLSSVIHCLSVKLKFNVHFLIKFIATAIAQLHHQ